MNVKESVMAKKYANAFVNLYFDEFTDTFLRKLTNLADFFKKNRYAYVYLRIPTISRRVKTEALDKIASAFKLEIEIKKLMYALLDNDRISILDTVLNYIQVVYRFREGIEIFKSISSHPLAQEEKEKVKLFIKNNTKNKILIKFLVDEKLIIGLRIQSNDFLWERSIEKQLNDIKKFMLRRAGLL